MKNEDKKYHKDYQPYKNHLRLTRVVETGQILDLSGFGEWLIKNEQQ